jgi:hypothetical protein
MSELRVKLKPWKGRRITVRGTLVKYGQWITGHRDIGSACIIEPEMNNEVLCQHVWVQGINHLQKCELRRRVELDALVSEYPDPKLGQNNYCLKHPGKLVILDEPPALSIPDTPEEEPEMLTNGHTDCLDVPGVTERATDGLETARAAKAFIKAVGGAEQAKKCLEALPADIPVPLLVEWVALLAD